MKLIVNVFTLSFISLIFFFAAGAQTTDKHDGFFQTIKSNGISIGASEALEGYYNFKGDSERAALMHLLSMRT